MCCLVLSNNLQTFEVINYIITLPFRGHGSMISLILIGLHAPRLSVWVLSSMNNIVRHLILMWFDAFSGDKKV